MLYDYRCNECENVFEIFCKMCDRNNVRPCTKCESINTTRCIASSATLIPPDRLGRMRHPDGFNDVLKHISNKAIDGHLLREKVR